MITPIVPSGVSQETAGERLALDLYNVLATTAETVLFSADWPMNERSRARGGAPHHVLVAPVPVTPLRRMVFRLFPFQSVVAPRTIREFGDQFADAAVVDLQWEEQGFLLRAVRDVAPHARIAITLHDVLSQRCFRGRDEADRWSRRLIWHLRGWVCQQLERYIVVHADEVVVLSEKDAALLPVVRGQKAHISIVPPRIEGKARSTSPSSENVRLLFVGYMARLENQDAMLWFAREVLPLVRSALPAVEVIVAGAHAPREVAVVLEQAGIDLLGFVPDLEESYRLATAVIAPLRLGAGVKFKVVEALVRAVPVVTTPVGAEGIGDETWFQGIQADPTAMAQSIIDIATNPASANQHAQKVARSAADAFGAERFEAAARKMYQ